MIVYLDRAGLAERIGLTGVGSLARLTLPEPDAVIGTKKGWLPETIDAWNAGRPGPGNWR